MGWPITCALRHRRADCNDGHWRFEPIAAPRNGPDQTRAISSECSPELADALHERIIRDSEVRPNGVKKLILGDETAGMTDEKLQHSKSLWPQRDFFSVEEETAAIQIEDIPVELQALCRYLRPTVGIARGHR